jgi:Zn-finger domain-containing protein
MSLKVCLKAQKSKIEFKVIQKLQKETIQLLESLREGIVVVQEGAVQFMNELSQKIFRGQGEVLS